MPYHTIPVGTRYPLFLKRGPFSVDTFYSMIRVTLTDGSTLEIPREEAVELVPYRGVFTSPLLKAPIEGLFIRRGKLVPVVGPLPESVDDALPVEQRPWLLVLRNCAQAVRGLPEFLEAGGGQVIPIARKRGEEDELLEKIDELLGKAA